MAVTALVLSIPSAALAFLDLTDRVRSRRRAGQLIDRAQASSDRHVAITIVAGGRHAELTVLNPDQVLELNAHEQEAGS